MSFDEYFASVTRSTFLAGDFVQDAVAAPELPVEDDPEGYGLTMIADSTGFTPTYGSIRSLEDGDDASRQILSLAILRRFSVRRSTYIHSPDYGYKLDDLINKDLPESELSFVEAEIASEAAEDKRVASALSSISFIDIPGEGRTVLISIDIQPLIGESFRLTIASNAVRMSLYQEAQGS